MGWGVEWYVKHNECIVLVMISKGDEGGGGGEDGIKRRVEQKWWKVQWSVRTTGLFDTGVVLLCVLFQGV